MSVGSPPEIPTVFWHNNVDDDGFGPTDFFYATVDEPWVDVNGDGIYEFRDRDSLGNLVELHDISTCNPDMIFGRISARAIKEDTVGIDNTAKERNLILNYSAKIHNYRISGSSLTDDDVLDRSLYFFDDDWSSKTVDHFAIDSLKNMQTASPDISVYIDTELTTRDAFIDLLTNTGYRFADLGHHGGGSFDQWRTASNGDFIGQNYAVDLPVEDIENLAYDAIKVNFISCFSCEDGCYALKDSSSSCSLVFFS